MAKAVRNNELVGFISDMLSLPEWPSLLLRVSSHCSGLNTLLSFPVVFSVSPPTHCSCRSVLLSTLPLAYPSVAPVRCLLRHFAP